MSRRSRRALIAGGAVLALVTLLAVTAISIARSGWFREQVRQRIVAEAERATGGRIEIGSFDLQWRTLTAQVNDFVIHGTEPPGSPPLLRARSITIRLKVLSVLTRAVDLQSVDVEQPQAYLIIYPDGATNVPQPRLPHTSKKSPVQTILDLAIKQFTVRNGTIQLNSERMPWSAAGQNLRAQFVYNLLAPSYRGDISIQPLHLNVSRDLPVDLGVKVALTIDKNKLTISSARIETPQSSAELAGAIQDFFSPDYLLQYTVRISLPELLHTLRFRTRPEGTILIAGNASFHDFGHYLITGKLRSGPLSLGQGNLRVRDVRAESPFRVDPEKIDLSALHLSLLGGDFNGRVRIEKLDRMRVEGSVSQFEAQRAAGLFGLSRLPWNGLLSGPVELTGLLSDLNEGRFRARAQLAVLPASASVPVHGLVDASYDGYRGTVDLGRSFIQLPSTRLDFAGILGRQLRVHLDSTNLDELLPAIEVFSTSAPRALPVTLQNGSAAFDGTVTGPLASPQIAGHVALKNFTLSQEPIDSLAADVALQKSALRVQDGSLTRGNLRAQVAGTLGLRDWKPDRDSVLAASVTLRGAEIRDLLALAGRQNLPATGALSASAQCSGSIGAPQIKADVSISKGSLQSEPFDRLTARINYLNRQVTVANAQLIAAANRLSLNATYTHAPDDFRNGRLMFEVASNHIMLDHFQIAHQISLAGSLQIMAKGSADISAGSEPAFRLVDLTEEVSGRDIQLQQRSIGVVHLTAGTRASMLTAHLESAVANSAIIADGQWSLTDSYPGTAQMSFTKLDLASLKSWLAPASSLQIAGSAQGKVAISGPALKPESWTATVDIPQLEISPLPSDVAHRNPQAMTLRNQGPIRLTMQKSAVRVESARLVAQDSDVTLTGTIALKEKYPLDVRLKGNLDLAVLEDFNDDVVSSGKLILDAALRGPLTQPQFNGRVQLQNADLNLATLPNGLSNANGTIVFSGDRATIQNLTAESGGGKVTLTGFASYARGQADLRIDLAARGLRVRYPEGVSTVANADLTWTGTSQRNLLSGTVTILRTGFNPRTDIASILATSAQPVRTPAARTGLLGGMNLDIQIETSPNVRVQSALAQQIQAEASLRLRGTATNPALLGRINITQGQLTFFGNKYTINQGSISFFNPVKIEPIVNIDLQTRARGIDITLTIAGPMNKLNVTYRSDPPLQFSDIVALLATGRAPLSDPSLAARETGAAQSWQQMGASALVGQAIANPLSGRLERFFGISKIKIDPTLTGLTNPQARLTIEQQVTPDITFTYITNVAQANPQVIRVEWSLNRQWSAVALRDENGLFGLDLYYKKRFK
jgi:translocation and assembly module TamB